MGNNKDTKGQGNSGNTSKKEVTRGFFFPEHSVTIQAVDAEEATKKLETLLKTTK